MRVLTFDLAQRMDRKTIEQLGKAAQAASKAMLAQFGPAFPEAKPFEDLEAACWQMVELIDQANKIERGPK